MTAPLSADRIKELREWLIRGKDALEDMPYRGLKATEYTDLLSILSDYSSLRAENEHRCDQRDAALESCSLVSAENTNIREAANDLAKRALEAEAQLAAADKELAVRTESQGVAMAEVERLREDCDRTADVVVEQMAQLAKQAPLVEAVDKWDGRVAWASVKPLIQSIDDYRAALAPREEKK